MHDVIGLNNVMYRALKVEKNKRQYENVGVLVADQNILYLAFHFVTILEKSGQESASMP